jgi:hypothetical protein
MVDPETRLEQVSYRLFHFDPTCAPAGRAAVTCFLPTGFVAQMAEGFRLRIQSVSGRR